MGMYLNSRAPYTLYQNETRKPYFVDKTRMLEMLFPFVEAGGDCICITRPRRFGKTVMANMIASFFQKRVIPVLYLILFGSRSQPSRRKN